MHRFKTGAQIMKHLILLLLIILITVMSWSSCARSKINEVAAVYTLSYSVLPSSLLTPTLSKTQTNDDLYFPQAKVTSDSNRFFELSIMFNDKLQQIISFFTHSGDEKNNTIESVFPSFINNQSTDKTCQKTVNAMLYL